MTRSPAARRYARALFELAKEQDCLETIHADLLEIARLGEHKAEFDALLSPFVIHENDRRAAWMAILKDKAHPLTLRFILFLIEKGRSTMLGQIILEFEAFYLDANNIVPIEIVSAKELLPGQSEKIQQAFAKRLGRSVKASHETDPSLIGGFLVRMGDVVHDYTVSHQLERLRRNLVTA